MPTLFSNARSLTFREATIGIPLTAAYFLYHLVSISNLLAVFPGTRVTLAANTRFDAAREKLNKTMINVVLTILPGFSNRTKHQQNHFIVDWKVTMRREGLGATFTDHYHY